MWNCLPVYIRIHFTCEGRKHAHLLVLNLERGQSGLQLLVPEHKLCLDRLLRADLTHLMGNQKPQLQQGAVQPASRCTVLPFKGCMNQADPLKIPITYFTFNSRLKTSVLNMNLLCQWQEQNAAAWPGYDWEKSSSRKHPSKNVVVAGDGALMLPSTCGISYCAECGGWSKCTVMQAGSRACWLQSAGWLQ